MIDRIGASTSCRVGPGLVVRAVSGKRTRRTPLDGAHGVADPEKGRFATLGNDATGRVFRRDFDPAKPA